MSFVLLDFSVIGLFEGDRVMTMRTGAVYVLMGLSILGIALPAAEAQTVWQGSDGGVFSNPDNWTQGKPGVTEGTGIHQTNTEIIFDESSSWNAPYDFDFYQAQTTTTEFTLGEASGGTENGLRLVDGLADRLSDVNDSVINVGALDAFWVGGGMVVDDQQTETEAHAKGYKWNVIGGVDPEVDDPAIVGVTGIAGPGEWLARGAVLSFGFEVTGSPSGIGFIDPLTTSGTIDSGVTSAIATPGDSTWTLQAVKLKAKRCQNLDFWLINHDARSGAGVVREFREAGVVRDFREASSRVRSSGRVDPTRSSG
jgi:hypothetical protein